MVGVGSRRDIVLYSQGGRGMGGGGGTGMGGGGGNRIGRRRGNRNLKRRGRGVEEEGRERRRSSKSN